MKVIVALMLTLTLAGCKDSPNITPDIEQARKVCKDRGGFQELDLGRKRVRCYDGTTIWY